MGDSYRACEGDARSCSYIHIQFFSTIVWFHFIFFQARRGAPQNCGWFGGLYKLHIRAKCYAVST